MDATASCGAFARELADRLAGAGVAELAAKTGLHESIIREITADDAGRLFSWEIVSACATAADVPREEMARLRELWVEAESAQWTERKPRLLHGIERQAEQARRRRPYDDKALNRALFDEYRPGAPWRKTSGTGHPTGRWRFEPWSGTQPLGDQRMPNPDLAMSLPEFYELLRQLHQWAGRPTYAEIEQRSWGALSRTTTGAVLGAPRPLQRQVRDHDNVRYLATVFGLPPAEVERWTKAYSRVRELPPGPVPGAIEPEAGKDRPNGTSQPSSEPLSGTKPSPAGPPSPAEPPQAASAGDLAARLRRWRMAALGLTVSTAVLGIAMALMVTADDSARAQSLQFSDDPRLLPGRPVRIPLRLSAGDWSLALHLRLKSTEVASACVNDARLGYVVERANGVNFGAGTMPKGERDYRAPAIRLGRLSAADSPQVVVSVSVPSYDAGCGFTIDLSGSIVRPS